MLIPSVRNFVHEVNEDERFEEKKIVEAAAKALRDDLGESVTVSAIIGNGDPKQVLVRHAEEFGADCIFTGATGFSNRIERFVLGSVSAAVAARAHCSVEVVR
jgi:nucleotide-binding universal stress UspA family protein